MRLQAITCEAVIRFLKPLNSTVALLTLMLLSASSASAQCASSATPLVRAGEELKPSLASWYDSKSIHKEGTCREEKCFTASGKEIHALERDGVLFAASNDLKIGTRVKVSNPESGKSVVVRILDRGGFGKYGRKIDLCKKAFKKIGNTSEGILRVTITPIKAKKRGVK